MSVFKKTIVFFISMMLCCSLALAESTEELVERIQRLEQELANLKAELMKKQQKSTALENLSKQIEIHGVIEVEGSYARGFDDSEESDVSLATAQLEVGAKLNDYVSGNIVFLWEEGETEPVDIDEAYITIGNTKKFPLYLKLGKQTLPLGEFDTNMISDPLSLELAEINESALSIGAEFNGFFFEGSVFNGDIDENEDVNNDLNYINEFSIYGGYNAEFGDLSSTIWVGYLNNIADSDTIQDTIGGPIKEYVGGVTANMAAEFKNFSLYASYAGAIDNFEVSELSYKGKGAEPKAWNIEAGYTMSLMDHDTTLAIAYQGSDEAIDLGLPKARYLGCISVSLFDNLSLAVEYAYDKDYDKDEGGTDKNAHTITTQLHLEF